MIKIDPTEPVNSNWCHWRDECARASDALVNEMAEWNDKWSRIPLPHDSKLKAQEKPKINDRLYKRQKEEFYMSPDGPFVVAARTARSTSIPRITET
jgi:hypothetical protein